MSIDGSGDRFVNGSHARHYVTQASGQHGAIVRFQEENAALKARVAELEAAVARSRAAAHHFELPYGFDDYAAAGLTA